jgi:hypothetical protein
MTKIAETYIHLKFDATDNFTKENREYLYDIAKSVAYDLFHQHCDIDIKIEDGSWKTWIALVGSIYIGIGQYGSFRSGLDTMVKDSKYFSSTIVEKFIDEKEINQEIIFRIERRLGVPGKIQRLFKKIDRLDDNITLTQQTGAMKQSLTINFVEDNENIKEEIKNEILSILEQLSNQQDKQLFYNSIPSPLRDNIPEDFPLSNIGYQTKAILNDEKKKWLEVEMKNTEIKNKGG